MSKEVAVVQHTNELALTDDKVQLLQDTICKGSTHEEFQLFLHACKRTGLDPFMKQIYPVKRWDKQLGRNSMTIQTGIDGYRLIADRTGAYAPGRETTYTYDKSGQLLSATAYVKKQTRDGTWHEISCSAFYAEYVQKTKDGKPQALWGNMPHVMLGKVAEALALRKAFPADLSGIYTHEEMQQANAVVVSSTPAKQEQKITPEMAQDLNNILAKCPFDYQETVDKFMKNNNFTSFNDLPTDTFTKLYRKACEVAQQAGAALVESSIVEEEQEDE